MLDVDKMKTESHTRTDVKIVENSVRRLHRNA